MREGGEDRRYFVHLPDGTLLYSIDAADNSRRYYHFDEMGSTLLLTGDSGAVRDRYAITPYGEVVRHQGGADNPFTLLGAHGVMQEGSTGLYHMGQRYYDSTTARFLSRDPRPGLEPRALNRYQYALGNPLLFLNPQGQGNRPGGRGSIAEGQVGEFVLTLPELLHAPRGPNENIAPRLALAVSRNTMIGQLSLPWRGDGRIVRPLSCTVQWQDRRKSVTVSLQAGNAPPGACKELIIGTLPRLHPDLRVHSNRCLARPAFSARLVALRAGRDRADQTR